MKKNIKKIFLTSFAAALIAVSTFSLAAQAESPSHSYHTCNWQVINGNYIPPSYSTHEFWCTNSQHGGRVYEQCSIGRVSWRVIKKCTICGSTKTDEGTSYSHDNSHCSQH